MIGSSTPSVGELSAERGVRSGTERHGLKIAAEGGLTLSLLLTTEGKSRFGDFLGSMNPIGGSRGP